MPSMEMRVPAVRGKMGISQFYLAAFPLGMVDKIFVFDPNDMAALPIEDRRQRELKSARVPEIARYIADHDDYVFSAITVSVNAGELDFTSSDLDPDIGHLHIPLETEWYINDGQHRVAGVRRALRERPELKDDTISVVILPDPDLERCQQVFSDLNRTVLKTSASLDIAYDHRSPMNRLTNAVVDRVQLFKDKTVKERVSLSLRSKPFSTLSSVRAANVQLIGDIKEGSVTDAELQEREDFAASFWDHVTSVVQPWTEIADGTVEPAAAREDYLSSYAIALWAVGAVGRSAIEQGEAWEFIVAKLGEIDWLKTNPEWQGICMMGDEVITRQPTRKAMAEQLRWKLGLGPRPTPVLELAE